MEITVERATNHAAWDVVAELVTFLQLGNLYLYNRVTGQTGVCVAYHAYRYQTEIVMQNRQETKPVITFLLHRKLLTLKLNDIIVANFCKAFVTGVTEIVQRIPPFAISIVKIILLERKTDLATLPELSKKLVILAKSDLELRNIILRNYIELLKADHYWQLSLKIAPTHKRFSSYFDQMATRKVNPPAKQHILFFSQSHHSFWKQKLPVLISPPIERNVGKILTHAITQDGYQHAVFSIKTQAKDMSLYQEPPTFIQHELNIYQRLGYKVGVIKHIHTELIDNISITWHLQLPYPCSTNLQIYLQCQNLNEIETLRIMQNATVALLELHNKKIIHRNLKPENLFIDDNKRVYIANFEYAKTLKKSQTLIKEPSPITKSPYCAFETLGTPAYYSAHTDIYSLAIIFLQLLAGTTAIFNKDNSINLDFVTHEDFYYDIIYKMLSLLPSQRQSLDNVYQALMSRYRELQQEHVEHNSFKHRLNRNLIFQPTPTSKLSLLKSELKKENLTEKNRELLQKHYTAIIAGILLDPIRTISLQTQPQFLPPTNDPAFRNKIMTLIYEDSNKYTHASIIKNN